MSASIRAVRWTSLLLVLLSLLPARGVAQAAPVPEMVLPYQPNHVHGSTLVDLPNGDILVAWFQGSGERQDDDVRILGARKQKGSTRWSEPFVLADTPGFPDINPVLFVDGRDRLWLLWYTVLAHQWETSLLKYRISEEHSGMAGAPRWSWQEVLHVKPGDDTGRGIQPDDSFVRSIREQMESYPTAGHDVTPEQLARWKGETLRLALGEDMMRDGRLMRPDGSYETRQMGYPHFRRLGWQSRAKPYFTETGRMIVPLYSDGFNFSMMAYTDDGGEHWKFSNPLVGGGNIQPAIARAENGDLVAYMRDNGPAPQRLHVSRSSDGGATWGPVRDSQLPNPGSANDIVTLADGRWVMIYNDTERGRHSLAVSMSADGGRSWPWTRHLERDDATPPRTFEYPSIILGRDGQLHASYSYVVPASGSTPRQRTIRYVAFRPDWIQGR